MAIPQTSVSQYQGAAIEGALASSSPIRTRTYVDDKSNVAQVSTGTLVDNAAGTYISTINGVPITTSRDTDAATSRAAHVAAINASAFVNGDVLAESGSGGVYTLTARTPGVAFTHTGSATGGSNANNVVATTANVSEEYLTPGRMVLVDTLTASQSVKRCKLPRAASGSLAGIVLHSQVGHDFTGTDDDLVYDPKTPVEVLQQGEVWVKVEAAVTPADVPSYRYAAGSGGTELGAFSTGTDTSTCEALTGLARYLTAAGAGELAKLAINLV